LIRRRMKSNSDFVKNLDTTELSLKPLKAQVGGHVYMKILNDKFVCKPLNERELQFYQNIPQILVEHIPRYQGTIVARNEETMGIRREEASSSKSSKLEYLVLENLTKDFQKPCVLDLKMGTRMYGDFASDAKRKSQRKKSKKSTSEILGVRFCGSQRFSFSKDSYEMFDKYVGRVADETELRNLVQKFFINGGVLRGDVIKDVLDKINKMKRSVLELDEYRFYSSSLLIIYEGHCTRGKNGSSTFSYTENSMDCDIFSEPKHMELNDLVKSKQMRHHNLKVKIKIIDFANISVPSSESDQVIHEGPDRGFLLGIDSLHEILATLVEEQDFQ